MAMTELLRCTTHVWKSTIFNWTGCRVCICACAEFVGAEFARKVSSLWLRICKVPSLQVPSLQGAEVTGTHHTNQWQRQQCHRQRERVWVITHTTHQTQQFIETYFFYFNDLPIKGTRQTPTKGYNTKLVTLSSNTKQPISLTTKHNFIQVTHDLLYIHKSRCDS